MDIFTTNANHFTSQIAIVASEKQNERNGERMTLVFMNLIEIYRSFLLGLWKLLCSKVFHSQLLKEMISTRQTKKWQALLASEKKKFKLAIRMPNKLVEWHIHTFAMRRDNLPKPLSCHVITFSRWERWRVYKTHQCQERKANNKKRTTDENSLK